MLSYQEKFTALIGMYKEIQGLFYAFLTFYYYKVNFEIVINIIGKSLLNFNFLTFFQ
jgi:hypothetical protein